MTKFQSIESLVLRAIRLGCAVQFAPGITPNHIVIRVIFRDHWCSLNIDLESPFHSADFLLNEMERLVEKVLKEPFPEDEQLLKEFEARGNQNET